MRISTKIGLLVAVAGGVAAWMGWQECIVSRGAPATPTPVSLGSLETGTLLESNFIRLGQHVRMYSNSIYRYRKGSAREGGNPLPSTPVTRTWYPVLSTEHPYIQAVLDLQDEYGAAENVPDDAWPRLTSFRVLVKSSEFRTVGDIPDENLIEDSIQGLVVSRIETLEDDEARLLRESFPGIDPRTVLLLEKDRRPASAARYLGLLGGGGAGLLVGLLIVLAGWAASRSTPHRGPLTPESPEQGNPILEG